jgi:hypothetical protein
MAALDRAEIERRAAAELSPLAQCKALQGAAREEEAGQGETGRRSGSLPRGAPQAMAGAAVATTGELVG